MCFSSWCFLFKVSPVNNVMMGILREFSKGKLWKTRLLLVSHVLHSAYCSNWGQKCVKNYLQWGKKEKSQLCKTQVGRVLQVWNLQAQFGNNEEKRNRNAGMVQGEVGSNTRLCCREAQRWRRWRPLHRWSGEYEFQSKTSTCTLLLSFMAKHDRKDTDCTRILNPPDRNLNIQPSQVWAWVTHISQHFLHKVFSPCWSQSCCRTTCYSVLVVKPGSFKSIFKPVV